MKRHTKLTRSERYRHETERALARMLARATRGSGFGFGCRLMSSAGHRAKPAHAPVAEIQPWRATGARKGDRR